MHRQSQRDPHHLEAAYAARDLGYGVGLKVAHAIVHVVVSITSGRGRQGVRHARGQIVGLPRCGFGPSFGVTLPSLPVEFGWPIGMPVCRPLGDGLFCCPRRVGSKSANLNPTPLLRPLLLPARTTVREVIQTYRRERRRLAVFYARLYVGVGRFDQPAQRCGVCGCSRPQLHMAHVFAGALQQTGRIRQGCAVKEPHIYVRDEYIDVGERRVAQTGNGTAVVQEFADLVAAFSHHLKPPMRDGPQLPSTLVHPCIDRGVARDSAVESQYFRFHRRSVFRVRFHGTRPCRTEPERAGAQQQASGSHSSKWAITR